MHHHPVDDETRQNWANPKRKKRFRFDALLLIFLPVSLSLIFIMATLGMQRDDQQWLPVNLMSRISRNYGVDPAEASRLAPVDPEIIEAVKRDAQAAKIPPNNQALTEVATTPTPTVEPTATPSPSLENLRVSAGGPYTGEEGNPVPLRVGGVDSTIGLVPGLVTYYWDLDNDGMYDDARGAEASVVFFDEGEYPIGVQATDLIRRIATDTTTVMVSNVAPIVNIDEEQFANEAEEVTFSAIATDPGRDILLYEWDFGDGSARAFDTLTPRHTYLDDGDYTVRLTVRDNDDGVTEVALAMHVINSSPLVDAGPDQTTDEGSAVFFSGTATDPAGDQDPLTYAWDLNYEGSTFTPDVSGPTASTVYPDGPAAIIAALRVQDDDGGETIDTVYVTVNNVAPVITGVTNDGPVGEGSPLTLQVNATDVGSDTITYHFDWENDGNFDAQNQPASVAHTWYNQGNYTVGIQANDDDGGTFFTTTLVSAYNVAPTAVAGGPSTGQLEGASVAFTGVGSSDPGTFDVLTYTWSFGDGGVGSGVNVTHIYADNNVYTATLTVTDDSGDSGAASTPVTILNANPVANAGPDRTIDEGASITFNGSATDPGAGDIPFLSYEWDFDYDGVNFNVDATGPSAQPPNSYPPYSDGPATYDVALRVRDDDYPYPTGGGGQIGEHIDILKVTVQNLAPLVDAQGPYTGFETQPTTLSGTATDVPLDTLTYDWDFESDGTYDILNQQTVNHTWSVPGVYIVTLRVTDDDGGAGFDTAQVTIGNAPPTAEANGPYTTTVNTPVTLSAAGSSDPTGDPLTYQWNFADGTPITTTSNITVSHIYLDDGVYTVILQVDDGRGGIDTDTAMVTVLNLPPTAVASAAPNPAPEGTSITFGGSGSSDPGLYDTLTYQWNFGDGSPSANGITVTHAYADDSVYIATLTVTDDGGAFDTDPITITISNANPTAVASVNPNPAFEGTPVTFDSSSSSDPGTGDTLTYEWNFGDGTPITTTSNITITHNYADDNVYTATLTVTDDEGAADTVAFTITISNTNPIVSAGGPYTTTVGIPVTLIGGASDVPSDTLTYAWDLDNNGIFETPGQIVTFTGVATTGVYTVGLQVDDGDGGNATDTTTVQVSMIFLAWPGVFYFLLRGKKLISLRRRTSNIKHKRRI